MSFDYIVCHYSEIGLKGRNRKFFEQRLVDNTKQALTINAPGSFVFVRKIPGRIIVKLNDTETQKHPAPEQIRCGTGKNIKTILQNVCGLANFSFAWETEQSIQDIQKICHQILVDKKFKTFRITALRSDKNFKLTSQQINEKVGKFIETKLNKKVKLEKPNINCFIEVIDNSAFVYLKKVPAVGGLPVGISGQALVLLSGGIDSPVASFYTNKRGVKNIFVHFHSAPYTSQDSIDKVKELVKVLNKFQYKSTLYLVPFADIQKQIVANTPAKFRVILYRRFMLRIAEVIARKEHYKALVTGESLGQVASQTIENIRAIEDAVTTPILRPLIGFDKNEIIQKAKEIGTYDISILPHDDCCTRFMPKNPETKAKLDEVKIAEKQLEVRKIVDKAIREMFTEKISSAQA